MAQKRGWFFGVGRGKEYSKYVSTGLSSLVMVGAAAVTLQSTRSALRTSHTWDGGNSNLARFWRQSDESVVSRGINP